jgi:hypothetical protein
MRIPKGTSEALRFAVILNGLVHRSLRHTVESLRECVLAPLARLGSVDVFFHSWDIAEINNPRAGESGETLDAADLARCLPEARGVFESQADFDASVDWVRLFRNNPMRHCCGNEEEARATLMNFRRALESQERAWRVFETNKTRRYDVVVATRADLRFLDVGRWDTLVPRLEKNGGQECPPSLWLPKFHSWGGVNDRFVIGNEEGIGIWSNRVAFAEQWLERANGESSEWLLKQWLEKERVRVGFLDFTFQRVRANGEVAERDRDLDACGMKEGMRASPLLKERFLILAREFGKQAECLREVLEPLGQVEVVVDGKGVLGEDVGTGCPDDGLGQVVPATEVVPASVWIPDEEAEGFGGLMGREGDFPRITAWSRALAHLAGTLKEDEAVWFVEDDVAGDAESFARLVELSREGNPDLAALDIRSKEEDQHWYFWHRAEGCFEQPARSFQPLCRLSARLIREVLRFRKERGGFTFHEVLFASIARRDGMKLLDWREDPECRACFSTFVFRPEVLRIERGIAHPVKNVVVHEAICALAPFAFPRMGRSKLEGWSILVDDYEFLVKFCREFGIRNVVEFGPGSSTRALLDAGCRVNSHEHDIGWLRQSTEQFQHETMVEVVHCPEGTLPEAPPFVPDLVFVDGPPFREGQEFSRLGPCGWALETCGCFLLHDAKRRGELATLDQMERQGMQVLRIPTEKGMALVVDAVRCQDLSAALRIHGNAIAEDAASPWTPEEWLLRLVLFHQREKAIRFLQTGACDGSFVNLLLERMFAHLGSEVHVVECYDGDEGEKRRAGFEENACGGGREGRIHLYEGETREVLAWMIAGDGYWEGFDFILVGDALDGPALLTDLCQAWILLKPGGILDMPNHGSAAAVAQVFLGIFSDRLDKRFESNRVLAEKRW